MTRIVSYVRRTQFIYLSECGVCMKKQANLESDVDIYLYNADDRDLKESRKGPTSFA